MSDEAPGPEIQINVKGPSELKLQITITTDKTVLDLKNAIAEKSDVEAARQRLIYSGRVLKDEDLLSVYKIQSSHTIHMVKGAARSGAASTSAQPAAPQPLPTMQTGQNPHDPLTQLNSHLGFGAMAGLNPFADMGLNQNDPNMLQGMMNNPQFLQQMSAMMSNPAIMDQIIASNPQMAGMGPEARAIMQSDHFRQMVSSPENLQRMLQMASLFNGGGMGGAAAPAFPAPGVPGQPPSTSTPAATPAPPAFPNLFGGAGGAGGAGGLPPFDPALLAALMGGAPPTTPPAAGAPAAGAPPPNLGALYNLLGAGAAPPPPADSRPPEERFQVQLQQLQDMGFTNASQNVRALLATGGNVHSAIEYILGGGGL
ncbi:Ubiquitin domain-containing protein DSK2 [Mycena sanguinolenta]|uniref:Ubiquitin domain-containing protein DSK2 n=1 Tax=Mycena sanguinolenta TaxID=230812 RepID=A0A8H7DGT2_9AGAR|nr:Ubiquitin domain-containing protein DSK2 [Mycena sanguinolenta]